MGQSFAQACLANDRIPPYEFLAAASKATPTGSEVLLSRLSSSAMICRNKRGVNEFAAESKSRPVTDPPSVRASTASGKSRVVHCGRKSEAERNVG